MYIEIETIEALEAFLQKDGNKLLFKHSTQCPISARAHEEYKGYLEENKSIPAALVKVIEARSVSNEIADRLQVKHESPQIFLLNGDSVIWQTSHGKIRKAFIAERVVELEASSL